MGRVISLVERIRVDDMAVGTVGKLVVARAQDLAAAQQLGPALDEYRVSLATHHPASTLATYGRRLTFLEQYIGRACRLGEVALRGLEAMVVDYRETHNDNTASQFCSTVRGFFAWCVTREYLAHSPAAALRGPRRAEPDPRGMSREQALDLLDQLRCELVLDDWRSVRNDTLVRTLLATGLRRTEAATRTWPDVDLAGRAIRVRGKGNKARAVPIYAPLVARLELLWSVCGVPEGPLFPAEITGDGAYRPLHPYSINMIFARWLQERLGFDLSPHDLRHTFAQLLNEGGVGIEEVSELLGHATITITQRYYGRPSQQRLRAAVDRLPLDELL